MDAIGFLKKEHRTVEELFRRFEAASDNALKLKGRIVDQIIVVLSKHASIEEQILYPAARRALGDSDCEIVLQSLEEHHVVKWLLNELGKLTPEAERFDAKMHVLMENVRQHVKEEEKELFPELRKAMKPAALKLLGEGLEKARAVAPSRPHPMGPDTPPGNILMTPVESAVDRGRDILRTLAARRAGREGRAGQTSQRTLH